MKAAMFAFVLLCLSASAAIKRDPGPIPELRPPRGEVSASVEKKEDLRPWFIGAGVLAVLAAIFATLPKKVPPPPVPPYVNARKQLETLDAATATPLAISKVVRNYLLDAFQIPARGATSAELLQWLSAHPKWDTQLASDTGAFLDSCDEAKFAPAPPPGHPATIEKALALIARIEGRRVTQAIPTT